MSATTSIEWTEKTWNPVRGCSIVSPGCVNCYAMKQAHRFSGVTLDKATMAPHQHSNERAPKVKSAPYRGLTHQTKAGPQWTGKVVTVESALLEPLKWRKPARIFVNSMSDLFHENVPDEFIDRVFAVMELCPQHTFQVLTKRAERMRDYIAGEAFERVSELAMSYQYHGNFDDDDVEFDARHAHENCFWPLPNVWLGVSCENQQYADERIPLLLETPAAVRWVSTEPLLGPIDFTRVTYHLDHQVNALDGNGWTASDHVWLGHPFRDNRRDGCIDWIVVGGESGPGARYFNVAWARTIVQQCRSAGVPVFVKQLGAKVLDRNDAEFDGSSERAWPIAIEEQDRIEDNPHGYREEWQGADVRVRLRNRKGGDITEWPEDLRVREYPPVASPNKNRRTSRQ